MSNIDISEKVLEIPALGRAFELGSYYDAVRDEIIRSCSTFGSKSETSITTTREDGTNFSVTLSDKLNEKLAGLNLQGSMKVSILSGMVELSGTSSYVNKKRRSSRNSTLHVKFKSTTATKELNMSQLISSGLTYTRIKETDRIGSATHIAMAIEYGTEAIFTFSKDLSETEKKKEVNGQLDAAVKEFVDFLASSENSVSLEKKKKHKKHTKNINCQLTTNFRVPITFQMPTTYEQALVFSKEFIQILNGSSAKDPENGELLGRPIKVRLYPLVLLKKGKNAPCLRHELGEELSSKCVSIMEEYEEVEDKIEYILQDPMVNTLNAFKTKLQQFRQYLKGFIHNLKLKMQDLVIGIRSGKITVDSFEKILNHINEDRFPFNPNRLDEWLTKKEDELFTVKEFQRRARNETSHRSTVLFFPSSKELRERMNTLELNFGFEFSFASLARQEPFLEQLRSNSINLEDVIKDDPPIDKLWCDVYDVLEKIKKEIHIFDVLAMEKSNDETFAFAVTAPKLQEYNEKCATEFSIVVHHRKKQIYGSDSVLHVCRFYPKKNIIDIVHFLIDEEISQEWNRFPLLALCRFYKKTDITNIARSLLEKKIDVNSKNSDGWNALHFVFHHSLEENFAGLAKLFVEDYRINKKVKTTEGWTAYSIYKERLIKSERQVGEVEVKSLLSLLDPSPL